MVVTNKQRHDKNHDQSNIDQIFEQDISFLETKQTFRSFSAPLDSLNLLVARKRMRRFAGMLGIATLSLGVATSALAQVQGPKIAGPAIPKAPATTAKPTPIPSPAPTPATAPRTVGTSRPAAVRVSRPKAASTPKRAATKVLKSKTPAKSTKSSSSKTATKSAAGANASSGSSSGGFGQGASGSKVVAVQTRLAELKYDITNADGKFGDQLYHAVMAFQKVNGLSRSGRVNNQTLAALETATEPTPLIATGGADRVEIDLQKQYLALYKGGALYRLLSISSGSGKKFCVFDPETKKTECDKAITPGGSFRVRSRWVGWRESKLGLLYNPLYFNGGIAIHGAPSVPASPASHGCVRIPMISAQWFPEQVGDGTPVYVFGGKEGAPVPLKSKAPADAKISPTTAPANPLATLPPAGALPSATLPAGQASAGAPVTNPLPTVPTSTTTTSTLAPTTTGLARLLTPSAGSPTTSPNVITPTLAPGATIAGTVTTGTVVGSVVTSVINTPPIPTQISGVATTTTTRPVTIVTSVAASPIATSISATAATTTTLKP